MQAEFTYFVLFVLIAAVLIMTVWRIFRAAQGTIQELNDESRRDRLQRERIARERQLQTRALRRGTRMINGKPRNVHWNQSDRRAQRSFHIDEAADEVFDPLAETRGMDIRTPWGWPGSKGSRIGSADARQPSGRGGLRKALQDFFKPKQVVDEEYRARCQVSFRHLVEDRYGPVSYNSHTSDIEWSAPKLPKELLEEREKDQVLAKKPKQGVERKLKRVENLRVVSDNTVTEAGHKEATGT